jgi:hypothetical protein
MSDLAFTARGAATGLAAPLGAVSRCVSIAVASLSLSLSLSWPGLLAPRAFRRRWSAARLGRVGRVGFSRALVVRGVVFVSGCVFGMVLCCLGLPGGRVLYCSGRGC